MHNAVYDALVALRVVDPDSVEHYSDAVLDRTEISVKRCKNRA